MGPDELRRIAFVTRRFGELQGLHTAAAGAGLLAGAALGQAALGGGWSTSYLLVLVLLGGAWSNAAAFPYIRQLYRETYGVVSPSGRIGLTPLVIFVAQVGLMIDFLTVGSWGPSVAAVGAVSYAVLVMVRDAPWRNHYVVVLAAGLVGVALSTAVPASSSGDWAFPVDGSRGPGILLSYAVVGLALLVAGLLDHRLLTQALAPTAEPCGAVRIEHTWARAGNGGLRAMTAGSVAVSTGLALLTRQPDSVLAISLYLAVTLVVPFVISIDTYRGRMRKRKPRSLDSMLGIGDVLCMIVLGTALTLDVFVGLPGISLCALALAAGCLWVVVRDWPRRPHYVIGFAAALFSGLRYPTVAAAVPGWISMFVFLSSAAVAVEGAIDGLASRRRRTPEGLRADTV